jgi:hypothetical protein
MGKPRLKLVAPATVNRTVMPVRRPNAELRRREHLTEAEVDRLMEAAKTNRWGSRNATMVLVAYRHGLRAAELVDLRCGIRWTSKRPPCTSVGSRRALLRRTLCLGTNCALCGGSSASRSLSRPSSSPRNGERPSRRLGLLAWSSERVR